MTAVVSERVMRVGNADLRIGADASLASHHHGRNAREVRLKTDYLKIEHQLYIILVLERNAGRLFRKRCDGIAFRGCDLRLHLSDPGEILIHLAAVGRTEIGPPALPGLA